MSRAIIYASFGGPEVLDLKRSRSHTPEREKSTCGSLPLGFGFDFAGVIDEVGGDADGFDVGERVYGGILAAAAVDFVVATPEIGELPRLPARARRRARRLRPRVSPSGSGRSSPTA